jgi:type I restriction enzyme, S subunit
MVVRSGILAHTFPVAVSEVSGTMNQDLKGIAPFGGTDPVYLAYYLCVMGRDILKHCSKDGTTVSSIDSAALRRFPVLLAPPSDQHRIVARIEEMLPALDAGVAALQRARANLKRYRAAILKAAVEGKLTEEWRKSHPVHNPKSQIRNPQSVESASELFKRILAERRRRWEQTQLATYEARGTKPPVGWKDKYKEPVEPPSSFTSSTSAMPKGWCWATVEQLITRSEYGTSVRCAYDAKHEPVLRIPNIAGGIIDTEDLKFSTKPLALSAGDELETGDLLICRTNGSISLVGKAALVTREFELPHSFASYLLRFRFVESQLVPQWGLSYLSSYPGRLFIESHAASSAGQHNISLTLIHGMPIPLPPVEEQRAIVKEVDELITTCYASAESARLCELRAARLRQGILSQAFQGKLA